MNNYDLTEMLPSLLSGDTLIERLKDIPEYDENIRNEDTATRLMQSADIYKIYYPSVMSVEIYNKLYLATAMSLRKKSNGYAVQNTVLKMAKKRALVDAALNVGNLSARFTQDVEDMNIEPDSTGGKNPDELKQSSKPKAEKPVTQKQIKYLETLMSQHNTSAEAMNKYCKSNFGVDDYKKITGVQASTLIEKFKAVE